MEEHLCAKTSSGDLSFAVAVNLSSLVLLDDNWLTSPQAPIPSRQHSPQNNKPCVSGPSAPSQGELLHVANASPSTSGAARSQGDLRHASPIVEPRKLSLGGKKSGIWDGFFQYNITYQKSKK